MFEFINTLFRHPLSKHQKLRAFARFVRWQIASRLIDSEFILPFIGSTYLIVKRGAHSATACFYSHLSEPEEMLFLAKYLRKDDLFVDIGANVGVFTIIASGFANCTSLVFEPSSLSVNCLRRNIAINSLEENVFVYQCALGATEETTYLSTELATMNRIVAEDDLIKKELVDVKTLDSFLFKMQSFSNIILKIDVEGFEYEVLKGSQNVLNLQSVNVVILESNSLSHNYDRFQYSTKDFLASHGFKPFVFDIDSLSIHESDKKSFSDNFIFIRNSQLAMYRLNSSSAFSRYQDLF